MKKQGTREVDLFKVSLEIIKLTSGIIDDYTFYPTRLPSTQIGLRRLVLWKECSPRFKKKKKILTPWTNVYLGKEIGNLKLNSLLSSSRYSGRTIRSLWVYDIRNFYFPFSSVLSWVSRLNGAQRLSLGSKCLLTTSLLHSVLIRIGSSFKKFFISVLCSVCKT